jgi:Cu(I)/Ag(I) efflux system membrane fusion protein
VKPVAASGAFSEQFKKTTEAYMALKDAFVKSDTAEVNRAADALAQAVSQIKADSAVQEKWSGLQPMLARTASSVRGASKLNDKRAAFEDLSKIMYEAVTAFGMSATVYKQYCPMAFDDKGAYWLSLNAEIRNPYFGDEMLECGEVQQVLTFEK